MNTFQGIKERLTSEHRKGYVYRGQVREHATPLVPSGFRIVVDERPSFQSSTNVRLRGVATTFVEELSPAEMIRRLSPNAFETFQIRLHLQKFLRTALGYPLAQMFTQQAGIPSEGLDVTSDIDVALFFATHEFTPKGYRPVASGVGVVYRFEVAAPQLSWEAIRAWDFYSCPSYLPSCEILALFGRCDSIEECLLSIDEYKQAIGWGPDFDLAAIRDSRPFELIRLPRASFQTSRIVRQAASLIIPDQILSQFWMGQNYAPPLGKTQAITQPAIEDISRRVATTILRFEHGLQNLEGLKGDGGHYFPPEDMACHVVRDWFTSFFRNRYGVLPIFLDSGSNLLFDWWERDGMHRDPSELFIL